MVWHNPRETPPPSHPPDENRQGRHQLAVLLDDGCIYVGRVIGTYGMSSHYPQGGEAWQLDGLGTTHEDRVVAWQELTFETLGEARIELLYPDGPDAPDAPEAPEIPAAPEPVRDVDFDAYHTSSSPIHPNLQQLYRTQRRLLQVEAGSDRIALCDQWDRQLTAYRNASLPIWQTAPGDEYNLRHPRNHDEAGRSAELAGYLTTVMYEELAWASALHEFSDPRHTHAALMERYDSLRSQGLELRVAYRRLPPDWTRQHLYYRTLDSVVLTQLDVLSSITPATAERCFLRLNSTEQVAKVTDQQITRREIVPRIAIMEAPTLVAGVIDHAISYRRMVTEKLDWRAHQTLSDAQAAYQQGALERLSQLSDQFLSWAHWLSTDLFADIHHRDLYSRLPLAERDDFRSRLTQCRERLLAAVRPLMGTRDEGRFRVWISWFDKLILSFDLLRVLPRPTSSGPIASTPGLLDEPTRPSLRRLLPTRKNT